MKSYFLRGWLIAGLISSATACRAAPDSVPAPQTAYPLQAEIVTSLSVSRLKNGDRVLLKLTKEWTSGSCTLPGGSAIVGHITALTLRSQSSKVTSVGLLFDPICGETVAQPLTWIAVLAADDSDLAGLHSGNPVAVQALRSASFGEGGGLGPASNTKANHTDLSGRQNPNLPAFLGPAPDRSKPRPTVVKTGEVWGIPDLALSVSTGPVGSSVLSSRKKDLRLSVGTVLVLSTSAPPLSGQAARPAEAPRRILPAAAMEGPAFAVSEQCHPPTCAVAPHSGVAVSGSPVPVEAISLKGLGYHRLKAAEMLAFEYGAALAYLGSDHLLFTFNPHTLIGRVPGDDPASHPHMVRAVVFNLRTSAVESSSEWRVADDRQYLWPLPGERILVHEGDRLRLLGPALGEIAAIPLGSRLAFVRSAPDRRHIVAGVIRELHTPDDHAKLAEANANGAEEEVSAILLDENLRPIEKTRQSSFAMPFLLSNAGRVTLLHAGGERWRYQEKSWAGDSRTLARLTSACIPEMTTLSSGLFFVSGCDTKTESRWYHVLRSDGSVALKGTLLSQDMEPLPLADYDGGSFALVLSTARDGYRMDSPFHGNDLTSEVARVFRSSDGRNLFDAAIKAPAPTRQPMAFGPGGAQIAVLDGEQIMIYALDVTVPDRRLHLASQAVTSAASP